MKELKFKLWCQEKQTMSTPSRSLSFHRIPKYGYTFVDINGEYHNCIVRQYLNYTDSKGEDVYEGDILLVNRRNAISGNKYTETIKVDGELSQDIITMIESFEIIGNIYQNPNLI